MGENTIKTESDTSKSKTLLKKDLYIIYILLMNFAGLPNTN